MKYLAVYCLALAGLSTEARSDAKPTTKRVEISVTKNGFEPDRIQVNAGQPVMLAITRKTDRTCAKQVVIELGDGKKREHDLPLDKTVEIPVTFAKKGELHYACSMDMIGGVIRVQ